MCRKEWPRSHCRIAVARRASRSENEAIRWAARIGNIDRCQSHRQVVDRLLADARVLGAIDDDIVSLLTHIGMTRGRFASVCIGLHDLGLPALVQLEILDALIPNHIRMAAKWDLIVAVQFFRVEQNAQ